MYLRELTLNNYRNYIKLELKFNSNLIVFVGNNGQGKTNILESIFFSCTGRSHRTSKDRELIRWEQDFSYIKTFVNKRAGNSLIEITLIPNEKKRIKINGIQAQKLGELMGHLNCVMFSPEDLKVIKEGPQERRRFIDIEISQIKPQYFYHLQQYNKILSHRNNLLKEIPFKPSLGKTLSVWDEQLAEIGAYITHERFLFVEKLRTIAKEIHHSISFKAEILDIEYKCSIPFKDYSLKAIKDNYLEVLSENQKADIERGNTNRGCHRDDLILNINNIDVRTYGSQGQQRTVVLSLKLAELELMHQVTGEYPILLLDDVMSELDQYRKKMLLEYLDNVQTLVTTAEVTNLPINDFSSAQAFEINNGIITCEY